MAVSGLMVTVTFKRRWFFWPVSIIGVLLSDIGLKRIGERVILLGLKMEVADGCSTQPQ